MSGTYTVSKISSSGNKYNRAQHHTFNTVKNGNNMTWKRKRPEKQEQPIEQGMCCCSMSFIVLCYASVIIHIASKS